MNLYEIVYRDADPASPDFTMRRRAYDLLDLYDRLSHDPDAGGWLVVKVARVQEDKPKHRWSWLEVDWRV